MQSALWCACFVIFTRCVPVPAGPSPITQGIPYEDYYGIRASYAGASVSQWLNVMKNNDLRGGSQRISEIKPYGAAAGVGLPAVMKGKAQISGDGQSIIYSATYSGEPFTDIFTCYLAPNSAEVVVAVGEL
jgi:hypothetical protein